MAKMMINGVFVDTDKEPKKEEVTEQPKTKRAKKKKED